MSGEQAYGMTRALDQALQGVDRGLMQRGEVAVAKQRSEMELAKLKHMEATGSVQQQVEVLNQQNRQLQNDMDKKDTFAALRQYQADGNPRHINRLFKENPRVTETIGVTEIAYLDPNNPEDAKMLRDAGGNPAEFLPGEMMDEEDVELMQNRRRRYVKSRLANGTWKVTDMQNVYAGTGFNKYLSEEELQKQLAQAKVTKALKSGDDSTAMMRNADAVAEAEQRIAADKAAGRQPSVKDKRLVQFGNAEVAGTTPARADIAEDTTSELLETFGGEDQFFNTDFSDRKNFTKAWPKISKIMRVEGSELTTSDRAAIHSIRELTVLGEPGSSLTAQQTGLLDRMLTSAKKYVSDETDGIDATSAYYTFRNSVRHALYGAALTGAEIQSFHDAFGTLGQKLGPVLQQFKTSLTQVKAKLDSIANLNNPYVTQVLLGADQQQMDQMLVAIEERLDYLNGMDPDNRPAAGEGERLPLKDRLQQRLGEPKQ